MRTVVEMANVKLGSDALSFSQRANWLSPFSATTMSIPSSPLMSVASTATAVFGYH